MSPFVFALRESAIPSSSIVLSKLSANISADDIDNIQVHSIEMAVLDRALHRQQLLEDDTNRYSPELTSQNTNVLSSVEMTPPEEDNDDDDLNLDYSPPSQHQQQQGYHNSGNFHNQQNITPTSSSVFMSPSIDGDDWWKKIAKKKVLKTMTRDKSVFFRTSAERKRKTNCCSNPKKFFFWRFNSVSKSFQYFLIWTNAKDPFFSIRVQKKNSCSLKNDENRNFFRLTLTLTWTCLYLLLFGTEKIIKRLYQCRIIDVFHCCRQNFRVNSYHVTIYFSVVF